MSFALWIPLRTLEYWLIRFFRAGFFPGAILLISKWYLPEETQTRIALLYSSAASGGAFSGILAFGIAKMDGVGGYEGGVPTVFILVTGIGVESPSKVYADSRRFSSSRDS